MIKSLKKGLLLNAIAVASLTITACSQLKSIQNDSAGSTSVASRNERPNIIVILADDMGYSDLGLFGSGIRTPNLDALARDGLLFTQFYNEAKCTQSRAALMSGRHSRSVLELPPAEVRSEGQLAGDVATLADVLRQKGYQTFLSGKWHLGNTPDKWPVARGFDHSFSLITGASSYYEMRMREAQDDPVQKAFWPPKPFMVKDAALWTPPASGFYMTDAITDAALGMIDQTSGHKEKPFFLYLAYTAPHWPLHALPEDIDRYRGQFDDGWEVWRQRRLDTMKASGIVPENTPLPSVPSSLAHWKDVRNKAQWARRMEVFAAQLDRLDQGVGKVIERLRSTGQLDNTLIIFLSDNGASSESMAKNYGYNDPRAAIGSAGSNTSYGEPWAAVSNSPLRAYKLSLYEGGIRTPMIVHWPGGLKRHGKTNAPSHITDLLPTIAQAAGATTLPVGTQGESLIAYFEGGPFPAHPLYWAFRDQAAVREGRWKAVSPDKGMHWQLYDINTDPGETRDLAATSPRRVQRMAKMWNEWASEKGAPLEKNTEEEK